MALTNSDLATKGYSVYSEAITIIITISTTITTTLKRGDNKVLGGLASTMRNKYILPVKFYSLYKVQNKGKFPSAPISVRWG